MVEWLKQAVVFVYYADKIINAGPIEQDSTAKDTKDTSAKTLLEANPSKHESAIKEQDADEDDEAKSNVDNN